MTSVKCFKESLSVLLYPADEPKENFYLSVNLAIILGI